MLLDQEQRQVIFAPDPAEPGEERVDDHRREAFERLVHQQERRVAHQRAPDRQHLLLAAREVIAAVPAARGERGKELVDPGERPGPGLRRDNQVLLDRQRREDLALLRHEADAEPRAPVGRQGRDIASGKADMPGMQRGMPHDGREQRRLADPVAAQDRERAAGRQVERDAFEHDRLAIPGLDAVEHQTFGAGALAHRWARSPR